jgi:hypothetical protein
VGPPFLLPGIWPTTIASNGLVKGGRSDQALADKQHLASDQRSHSVRQHFEVRAGEVYLAVLRLNDLHK